MHHRRILAARALLSHPLASRHVHPRIRTPTFSRPSQRQPRPHSFHTTRPRQEDNHYAILESTPDASAGHLKKQFYALSKQHHPDLHPDDDQAAQRFVRISTAWSILGNASKRAAYDREMRARDPAAFAGTNTNPSAAPSGSHSSAQAASWGARPASGLSRRRGAFRGPPPSFYRSGGWGAQEGKRRAAAEGAEQAAYRAARDGGANGAEGSTAGSAGAKTGGFSPGQGYEHADFEIPHFDREGHFRRQEGVQETLRKRRVIWAEREAYAREQESAGGGTAERMLLVGGVLAATAFMGWIWERRAGGKRDR